MNGEPQINGWLAVVIVLVISPVLVGYMQSGLNAAWKAHVPTATAAPSGE
jgi:hypothetical protein